MIGRFIAFAIIEQPLELHKKSIESLLLHTTSQRLKASKTVRPHFEVDVFVRGRGLT